MYKNIPTLKDHTKIVDEDAELLENIEKLKVKVAEVIKKLEKAKGSNVKR